MVTQFSRLEIVIATAIVLLGLVGWKFVIFDIWLAEVEAYSMSTDIRGNYTRGSLVQRLKMEEKINPWQSHAPAQGPPLVGIAAGWIVGTLAAGSMSIMCQLSPWSANP